MFMVDSVRNHCNDWSVDFGDNVEDYVRYSSLTKDVAAVMFLGLVCSNGEVSSPILFDDGYQLNANGCINIMTSTIIPWIRKVVGKKKFVFQQDGASACRPSSKKSLTFGPSQCSLPRAQTSNPLDYSVWWRVESSACKTQSQNVKELKACITKNWANLNKGYVVDVCCTFRGCLEHIIKAKSGYIN